MSAMDLIEAAEEAEHAASVYESPAALKEAIRIFARKVRAGAKWRPRDLHRTDVHGALPDALRK